MMVVFELSMPGRGSWNGGWSGEGMLHARVLRDKDVPKECVGKDYFYRWDDGWTACVSTRSVPSSEANKIRKKSCGFCGYDWMIRSICSNGEIISPSKGR